MGNEEELVTKFGTIYGREEIDAVAEVIKNGAPTNDQRVRAFEEAFAKYCGVKWAIAVTSGTTALNLGCVAAGVGPCDLVLVPAITWIATANAAALQGAEIGFVDVDPETYNMDPVDLEEKITENTKLVIPVHLYGQPCDMDAIERIAREHNCLVMTDCAHAPGAEYKGRMTGSMGDMGAFSFHQQKNISTLGEGGMLTTDDDELYEAARIFQNHGRLGHSHEFRMIGHNYRLTDVQAAVGLLQLRKLDYLNDRRIANAEALCRELKGCNGIRLPRTIPGAKHVFHLFNVVLEMPREPILKILSEEYGITPGTHYEPIHRAKIYERGGRAPWACPTADDVGVRNITLPIHPRLTDENISYMGRALAEASTAREPRGPPDKGHG